MKNNTFSLLIIFSVNFFYFSCHSQDIFIPKFTNINPISFTDVTYISKKDTVLVTTYNGRIAKIIKDNPKEIFVAKIEDEIYSISYNPEKKVIAITTLENGILIVDINSGKILKRLPIKNSWCINAFYNDNFKYLISHDQDGNRYVWDVNKGYEFVNLSKEIPMGGIKNINEKEVFTIITSNKLLFWDSIKKETISEFKISLQRFADMDSLGNFLSLDYNECTKFNIYKNSKEFKIKHPNMPFKNPNDSNEIVEIPFQMQLTAAKFAGDKIVTASIDRSIRVWEKNSGELIETLTLHNATINKIKVSKDQSQVVSIDLKGGIHFWEVK